MGHEQTLVKLAQNGRISIPARQRRLLNLEHGGLLVAEVQDGELRLRPARMVLAELRDKVSADLTRSGDSVDQFIADRRAEAAGEDT
jgi:AbrB family looped-hinge helix DNA binding protein